MASLIFPAYKAALMSGTAGRDLTHNDSTDGPFCALIDEGVYTLSTAHDFWNDASAGLVSSAQRLTSPTVTAVATGATFDANDVTFPAVPATAPTIEAVMIYRHNVSTDTGTWPLVAYLQNDRVTGLPVTPNSGDLTITWDGTGIFTD